MQSLPNSPSRSATEQILSCLAKTDLDLATFNYKAFYSRKKLTELHVVLNRTERAFVAFNFGPI